MENTYCRLHFESSLLATDDFEPPLKLQRRFKNYCADPNFNLPMLLPPLKGHCLEILKTIYDTNNCCPFVSYTTLSSVPISKIKVCVDDLSEGSFSPEHVPGDEIFLRSLHPCIIVSHVQNIPRMLRPHIIRYIYFMAVHPRIFFYHGHNVLVLLGTVWPLKICSVLEIGIFKGASSTTF